MKSLRSAGSFTAARAAVRSAQGALERRAIGQDGKTGRAAGLIGAGERLGIEVFADQSFGRAGALDLGDQAEVARFARGKKRIAEAARRRAVECGGGQRLAVDGLERGDLLALVLRDLVEDRHAAPVREQAARLASVSLARPESMASAARPAPSFKSS